MQPIDPDTLKYYEDYLDLFNHPGWKRFIEDLSSALANDKDTAVSRCDTSDKWFEERGKQSKVNQILGLPTTLKALHEELTNPEVDDSEQEEE